MSSELADLFRDMLGQEEAMIELYTRMSAMSKDRAFRSKMDALVRDESKHANNAREMLEVLKE